MNPGQLTMLTILICKRNLNPNYAPPETSTDEEDAGAWSDEDENDSTMVMSNHDRGCQSAAPPIPPSPLIAVSFEQQERSGLQLDPIRIYNRS